jgi:Flp pilus assembly protein CpaB
VPLSDLTARLGGWPRRVLALLCLLLAGVTAVAAHRAPTPRAGHPIVVAARDLPAGATLHTADVRVRSWPDELRPAGALPRSADAVGRRVGGAIRAGEAITGARLVGAGLTTGLSPQLRGVPVQIAGAGFGGFVHAGDWIDLLVGDPPDADGPAPPSARLLAHAVRVLAVLGPPGDAAPDADSVGIVVAVDGATALKIAAVSGRALVATVRDPP